MQVVPAQLPPKPSFRAHTSSQSPGNPGMVRTPLWAASCEERGEEWSRVHDDGAFSGTVEWCFRWWWCCCWVEGEGEWRWGLRVCMG